MRFQFLKVVSPNGSSRCLIIDSLKARWAITSNAASSRAYGVGQASALDNRHFLCLAIVFYL